MYNFSISSLFNESIMKLFPSACPSISGAVSIILNSILRSAEVCVKHAL